MVICKYFLRGSCNYGNNCWNEHTQGQGKLAYAFCRIFLFTFLSRQEVFLRLKESFNSLSAAGLAIIGAVLPTAI